MENIQVDDSQDDSETVNLIHVQYEDHYEPHDINSQDEGASTVKSKYYKQTYRTAWETMSDFKGWLRGVQGQPTRAYCLYCEKTLHAHRLSLLKHTCTIRHQKAAQIHSMRKNKRNMQAQELLLATSSDNIEDSQGGEEETIVEYTEVDESEAGYEEQEQEEMVEDEEDLVMHNNEAISVHFQKRHRPTIQAMPSSKPPISTHVLDSTRGAPVNGLQVSLYKLIEGRWTFINEGLTNSEGRFGNFLNSEDFAPGRYKIHFDVDKYFEARKQETLFPFIEIIIDCKSAVEHYHVPLLLSPYSYSTYRGT